jgi:hypothetical protein
MDIVVRITSPKIIFDEYLLGEKVMDSNLPALFLLNMGKWEFTNKVYLMNVEKHTDYVYPGGLSDQSPIPEDSQVA